MNKIKRKTNNSCFMSYSLRGAVHANGQIFRAALPLLRQRNANNRLQSTARVLLESDTYLHGQFIWRLYPIHWQVTDEHVNKNQINYNILIDFKLNRELSRFIAAGRLHCKIDRVKEIVETNRPDNKNWQYQVGFTSLFNLVC